MWWATDNNYNPPWSSRPSTRPAMASDFGARRSLFKRCLGISSASPSSHTPYPLAIDTNLSLQQPHSLTIPPQSLSPRLALWPMIALSVSRLQNPSSYFWIFSLLFFCVDNIVIVSLNWGCQFMFPVSCPIGLFPVLPTVVFSVIKQLELMKFLLAWLEFFNFV